MGIVETASTQKGFDLAGLIEDGVPVGFSLRGMGESEVNSSGITTIRRPFEMITYDAVSNPSHKDARMVSRVSESQLVVPKSSGKLLMENTFGSITLDRSGLLYGLNKKSKSLDQRLSELTETINALRPDPESVKKMFRKKSIVGLLEAYLNDDSTDVSKSYHNSMIEYLTDYFDDEDKRKTNREKSRKDLLKKHFNIDDEDMDWKDSYKDYLK